MSVSSDSLDRGSGLLPKSVQQLDVSNELIALNSSNDCNVSLPKP